MKGFVYNFNRRLTNVAVVVVATMAINCGIFFDIHKDVPNDAYFERIFRENRKHFEALIVMSQEDSKVTRISYDFTHVAGKGSSSDTGDIGFSSKRWDEYKDLFDRLGLEDGINREDDGTIAFLAFTKGLGVSGLVKGYLYSKVGRNCNAASLDGDDLSQGEKRVICKRIDNDWYLYVSR